MNVYELLKKDHEKVKALFEELDKTTTDDAEKREELFEVIKEELTVHAEAEEKLFYSLLRDETESRDAALEATEEHKVMRRLIHDLDNTSKSQDQWHAKLKVLMENTLHHIKEEEGTLFKKAKKVLDTEDEEEIADQIEAYKEEAMGAPDKG